MMYGYTWCNGRASELLRNISCCVEGQFSSLVGNIEVSKDLVLTVFEVLSAINDPKTPERL